MISSTQLAITQSDVMYLPSLLGLFSSQTAHANQAASDDSSSTNRRLSAEGKSSPTPHQAAERRSNHLVVNLLVGNITTQQPILVIQFSVDDAVLPTSSSGPTNRSGGMSSVSNSYTYSGTAARTPWPGTMPELGTAWRLHTAQCDRTSRYGVSRHPPSVAGSSAPGG